MINIVDKLNVRKIGHPDTLHEQMRAKAQNLDFLYLLVQTANISIRLLWRLFQFHDSHHWVGVIRENTHNCMDLANHTNHIHHCVFQNCSSYLAITKN